MQAWGVETITESRAYTGDVISEPVLEARDNKVDRGLIWNHKTWLDTPVRDMRETRNIDSDASHTSLKDA